MQTMRSLKQSIKNKLPRNRGVLRKDNDMKAKIISLKEQTWFMYSQEWLRVMNILMMYLRRRKCDG